MTLLRIILNSFFVKKLVKQKSIKEAHEYWKNPPKAENRPERYLVYGKGVESFKESFTEIIEEYVSKDEKILEIGCNVGKNLNHLYKNGYHDLTGVEINKNALHLMLKSYPELVKIKTHNNSIEEKIKEFGESEFDLVFTIAVLMHIPKESDWIFKEIVRITKKLLIIIENETGVSRKNFRRNYKKIFEKLGMIEIKTISADTGYTLRCFKHVDD